MAWVSPCKCRQLEGRESKHFESTGWPAHQTQVALFQTSVFVVFYLSLLVPMPTRPSLKCPIKLSLRSETSRGHQSLGTNECQNSEGSLAPVRIDCLVVLLTWDLDVKTVDTLVLSFGITCAW